MVKKYGILNAGKKIVKVAQDKRTLIESCQLGEEVVELNEYESPFAVYWLPDAPRSISITTKAFRVGRLCVDWSGGIYTLKGKKIYGY